MATQKTIRKRDYTFMQDRYGGGGDLLTPHFATCI